MADMNNKPTPNIKKYFPSIDDNSLQAFNTVYEVYKKYSSIPEKLQNTNDPLIIESKSEIQKETDIIISVIYFCTVVQSTKKENSKNPEKKIIEEKAIIFFQYVLSYIDSHITNNKSKKNKINKIAPLISNEEIDAFNFVYKFHKLLLKRNAVLQKILFQKEDSCTSDNVDNSSNDFKDILFYFSEPFMSKNLILLSYEDKIKLLEKVKITEKIIFSSHCSYIQSLLVKDFFKAEYIKRNFYLNLSKNKVNDIRELSLFTLLSKWRDKREERIKAGKRPPDCNLSNCYFSEKRQNTSINMRPPFFYNTACRPPLQDSDDPNDYCAFKTDIFFSILVLHNKKYPGFLTRINDIRLSNPISYPFYNSSTDSWSIEFRSIIESLHRVSFETGLLIFDLFGLASPEKLLSDSCENNSSISDEIVKLPRAEFFLKADPGGHENGQGFSDKLHDPQNMGVLKKDPDKKTIEMVFMEQFFQKFEFIIGIEDDITSNDFSIKKEVLRIRKAVEEYDSSMNYDFCTLDYLEKCIVFGFNTSSLSFNAKKCIEDVKIIIKSYRTALMPFDVQLDYFQDEISDVYERIQSVKNYQENNRSRTIGLYIWDQVHLLNKPINEAIHHFVESNLYLKIMKLSNNEIKVREYKSASKTKSEYKGTQEEYNEVYRNYQYANCCIEHAEILTGAECEKLISLKK